MVAPLAGQAAFGQAEPVPPDSWARRQEIAQLGEITPNVAADFDPVLGTPTFIRSTAAFLTRRSGRTALQIVADFVNDNPATFGVSLSGGNFIAVGEFPNATYRVLRDFVTPSLGPTGVRHLTYQQTHNGQDIYGCLLTANVTGDGMLVNIGSRFVAEPASPMAAPACDEANRTVRDVVAAACDEVNDSRIADIVNLIAPEAVCAWDWKDGHAFQGVGETALWVRSVLHPVSASELVQAWVVRLPANPAADDAAWECIIRHSDLSTIDHYDRTMRFCQPEPVTHRTYPNDSPVPGSPGLAGLPGPGEEQDTELYFTPSERILQARTFAPTDDPSPAGWINDAHYPHCATGSQLPQDVPVSVLCGNNVVVRYTSSDAPAVGVDRTFDFDLATELPEAVATQVFVVANEWHDRMYSLGFDEVAVNCQADNFGRGGVGGDAVEVWVLDNFWPGATDVTRGEYQDGAEVRSRFHNATGNGAGVRHSALDRHIVYHELSHIMSSRLHVGTVFEGAGNLANGLWEGWGEYFGVALRHGTGNDVHASHPAMPWATRPEAGHTLHYYFGNALYPYTPQMTPAGVGEPHAANPLTYKLCDWGLSGQTQPHAYPEHALFPRNLKRGYYESGQSPTTEPPRVARTKYRVGEVWTSMLLQCRARLSEHIATGGQPIGGDAANDLLLQLVVDGMKLDPGAPKVIDARDAILQADLLRSGGTHQPRLWDGFRERGLGWNARQPKPREGATAAEAILDVNRGRFLVEDIGEVPAEAISIFLPDDPIRVISTFNETEFDVFVVSPAAPLTSVVADAETGACALGLPKTLAPNSPGHYRFNARPAPRGNSWTLQVKATNTDGGEVTKEFVVSAGVETLALPGQFDMESEAGWVGTPAFIPPPEPVRFWMQRVDPSGGLVQPSKDATPGAGRFCWVTQDRTNFGTNSPDADDVDPGTDGLLESPLITVEPGRRILVEFRLWYGRQSGGANDAEVEVKWHPTGGSPQDPTPAVSTVDAGLRWQLKRMVFDSASASTGKLSFRFTDPGTDTAVEGGIDDVRVSYIEACDYCCDGDINMDGNVDQDDVATLIGLIAGDPVPRGVEPDFNHDGNVDQDDLADFISFVGGSPCPW